MLARAPGEVAHANVAQVKRSPPAAVFTPSDLGQRGKCSQLRRERTRGRPRTAVTSANGAPSRPAGRVQPCRFDLLPPCIPITARQRTHRSDWASRAARIGPLPGDQATVPPQDGARRDQPVRPQPSRQEPDQRGQHRAVGPVPPGAARCSSPAAPARTGSAASAASRWAAWPRPRSPGTRGTPGALPGGGAPAGTSAEGSPAHGARSDLSARGRSSQALAGGPAHAASRTRRPGPW